MTAETFFDRRIDGVTTRNFLGEGAEMDFGEYDLWLQPIVHVEDHRSIPKVIAYEALLRRIDGGVYSTPVKTLAEAGNDPTLACKLWRFTVSRACAYLSMLAAKGAPSVVSINAFESQIVHPNFHNIFMTQCAKNGVSPNRLIVEVHEDTVCSVTVRRVLGLLQPCGAVIAMDDYGRGAAGATSLNEGPFTIFKLDKGFIVRLRADSTEVRIDALRDIQRLVRIITGRRTAINGAISIVAEGIENGDEVALAALWSTGIDIFQGYRYGRPAPIGDYLVSL